MSGLDRRGVKIIAKNADLVSWHRDALVKLDGLMEPVKRTPLASTHSRLGARMTEFGGYEMPLSYRGIIQEHLAVRRTAGLFDLSHMGEFHLEGPHALDLLERAMTNSASRLVDGQAQYTIMCADDGGTIDDLIVYRLAAERYMLCVNASNITADWEWLCQLNRDGAALTNHSDETALIAIQGPHAIAILARMTELAVASIGRFRTMSGEVAGVTSLVARTGYTGEDGFEIFCPAADGERLFEALLTAGAADGIEPCGLGARDTLRMEAGLPLYGHELDRTTSPLEAGLRTFVKFGHGCVGEVVLAAQRDNGTARRPVGIRTDDGKSIARQGYKIYRGESEVGVVTSGTYAPSFDRPLAMAYVATSVNLGDGDHVEVAIRNRRVAATLMPLPFYRRERAAN
jgi:aminomethyltransferase